MGENTTTNNKTTKNSTNTTTNKNKDGNSTSKFVDKSKSNKKEEQQEITEGNTSDMGVATDIRKNFGVIKERVLEKLAAASVPVDALDNARHFLEGVVRDVTVAAQGLTKDALHRIKTHLVDIMPSLSPAITRKVFLSLSHTIMLCNCDFLIEPKCGVSS